MFNRRKYTALSVLLCSALALAALIYNLTSLRALKPAAAADAISQATLTRRSSGNKTGPALRGAASPIRSAAAQTCVPPPAGLVNWWPGEGNANDIQGASHGALQNGATFASGMVGQAFSLDGIDDYVSLPDNPAWNFGTGGFTVDFWARSSDSGKRMHALSFEPNYGVRNLDFDFNDPSLAPGLWVYWNSNGPNRITAGPLGAYTDGQWRHFALTRSGSAIRLYVDGSIAGSASYSDPIDLSNSTINYIGASGIAGTLRHNWDGQIDEVGIFNRALSDLEIQAIFNAGSAGKCSNTPPAITASSVTHQQGSAATNLQIATVSDANQAADTLTVTAAPGAGSGVTVSNVTINAAGEVFADVAASCAATDSTFTLTVADNQSATATETLTVTVTANTPPTLGTYPSAVTINVSSGGSITPSDPPGDNGAINSVAISIPGFTGSFGVNQTTGVVTISNANPSGNYTVTMTVTDNCGATATRTISLIVNGPPGINGHNIARQRGSAGTVSGIATVSDDLTPAGNLVVTVVSAPPGITITNIVNANGAVTANVTASCAAALGSNIVLLGVQDGDGIFRTSNLGIIVVANTPPALGAYPNTSVMLDGGAAVAPNVAPQDNGSVTSATAAAGAGLSPFAGALTVNPSTGVVTITDAKPAGTYTVTVAATDNCGLSSTSGFTLTVGTPQQQVSSIIAQVQALVAEGALTQNQGDGLINKLDQIINKLDQGQTNAACNQLNAFVNQVNAFINSGSLPPAQGQALINAANALKTSIGC